MIKEITYERNIINFCELAEEWQKEAISNLDKLAEEANYIEPLEHHKPAQHVLLDLTEAMRTDKDSIFNAIIGVSNNSAIGLNISPCGEACNITYI